MSLSEREAFPVQLPRATAAQFPIAPFWRGEWSVSYGERNDPSRLAGGARQGRASSLARPVRKQAGQREEHGGAGAGASAPEAAARRLLRGASCTPGERTPTARAPFALHCSALLPRAQSSGHMEPALTCRAPARSACIRDRAAPIRPPTSCFPSPGPPPAPPGQQKPLLTGSPFSWEDAGASRSLRSSTGSGKGPTASYVSPAWGSARRAGKCSGQCPPWLPGRPRLGLDRLQNSPPPCAAHFSRERALTGLGCYPRAQISVKQASSKRRDEAGRAT